MYLTRYWEGVLGCCKVLCTCMVCMCDMFHVECGVCYPMQGGIPREGKGGEGRGGKEREGRGGEGRGGEERERKGRGGEGRGRGGEGREKEGRCFVSLSTLPLPPPPPHWLRSVNHIL